MARKKKRTRKTQAPLALTPSEEKIGLESLAYELVILGSALVLRDKRDFFKRHADLPWGVPQLSHDVLRLKSRLLIDFFLGSGDPRDLSVAQFAHITTFALPSGMKTSLRRFKTKVDAWTIHLVRRRATDPGYSQQDREEMEKRALELLELGGNFVDSCTAAGAPMSDWGKKYVAVLQPLLVYLKSSARVPEGTPVPPGRPLISLQDLV